MSAIPCSLATLHRHSVFAPTAGPEGDWELLERPNDADVGSKTQRVAVRDNDLLLAVGSELRMLTLTGESWEVRGDVVGSYKTLTSPHLGFDILSLHLNPSKRLLAVVGRTQIVVLVLPKAAWSSGGGQIRCRSIVIDAFQYSPSSTTSISKAAWHPLGESGQSLWILSADGKLREYDLQTPSDPSQTFSLLASAPSSSKFSAVDPLSRYATSFAFGAPTQAGWGEMAIHALMANGDVYVLCPVLPLRTQVQLSYVHRLKAYASVAGSTEAQEWVEALAKQVPADTSSSAAGPPKSILSRSTVVKAKNEEEPEPDRQVLLHPPHLTASGGPAAGKHAAVERQGPVVLDPAPPEGEEEDAATDLVLLEVPLGEHASVGVCAVVWSNGRADFGVQLDAVEARWIGKRPSAPPVLPIAESIQLPAPASDALDAPRFERDAVANDVVYIGTATGVARVALAEWAAALMGQEDVVQGLEASQIVKASECSIQAVTSINNLTLGYAVLALSSTNQLAAIDLDTSSADAPDEPPATATGLFASSAGTSTSTSTGTASDPHSLILSQPYDAAAHLSAVRPPRALLDATSALSKLPTARQPLTDITPHHARAILGVVAQLHAYIQAIREASLATERHLDLQVRESKRQLEVLRRAQDEMGVLRGRDIEERAQVIREEQERLRGRVDGVMRAFVDEYKPGVGGVERRWFDEVGKVADKVRGGAGGQGVSNLEQRVKQAQEQLNALLASRKRTGSQAADDDAGIGRMRPLETALTQRSDELRRLMEKVEALSMRVESALDKQG